MRAQLLLIALISTAQAVILENNKDPIKKDGKKLKECQDTIDDITICKHETNNGEIRVIPPWAKPKPEYKEGPNVETKPEEKKDEKKEAYFDDPRESEHAKEVKKSEKPEAKPAPKEEKEDAIPELEPKQASKKKSAEKALATK